MTLPWKGQLCLVPPKGFHLLQCPRTSQHVAPAASCEGFLLPCAFPELSWEPSPLCGSFAAFYLRAPPPPPPGPVHGNFPLRGSRMLSEPGHPTSSLSSCLQELRPDLRSKAEVKVSVAMPSINLLGWLCSLLLYKKHFDSLTYYSFLCNGKNLLCFLLCVN